MMRWLWPVLFLGLLGCAQEKPLPAVFVPAPAGQQDASVRRIPRPEVAPDQQVVMWIGLGGFDSTKGHRTAPAMAWAYAPAICTCDLDAPAASLGLTAYEQDREMDALTQACAQACGVP